MIYSRWRPDRGGYDYFESTERRPLGDDLPVPRLLPMGALGVASTDIGRRVPAGARYVGSGELARGSITPLSRSGLSGVVTFFQSIPTWLVFTGGVTLGWLLRRGSKR